MKWIGQHIVDFIARFRSDVYLESLTTTSETSVLVVDSDGKVSKSTSVGGDISGVTITTDSGGGGSVASDTGGSADFSILGTVGVGVTNSGATITATAVPGEIDHDSLQNFLAAEHVDWAGSGTGTIHASNYTDTTTNTQNTTVLSFVDSSNDILLRNTTGGAGSGTDDIKFVAGGNITLTHTDADNITIAATDGSTDVTLNANVTDVLTLSTQAISATDPGDADILAGWDHSANKFTYLSAAHSRTALGLGTSAVLDTAVIANGGAGVATADQIHTFVTTQTDATDANTSGQAGTVATIAGLAPNTATTQATQAAITTCANLTTVGALASGTIASGFGNIDNGASTLDTGAATLASLTCTAAGTFGGGYGSTGATISTAGVGQFNGALNTDGAFSCVGGIAIIGNSSGGGFLKFHEDTDNGTNFVALRAPEAVTTSTTLLLPDGDGAANARLKTDGSGNLDWANETVHAISGTNAGDVGDGAEVVYFGSGTVIAGLIYYYKDDGSWEITNANAAATSIGLLGVALAAGTASTVGMCIRGMVNLLTDSTGGVGDVLWLETATNGRSADSAPTGGNDIARVIGYCLNADGRRIFFNPDNTFVEVTA